VEVKVEEKNTAIVFVPADQLSLAIGKDGRNVRLAAQLTGWKIDIKTVDVPVEEVEGKEPAQSPAGNLTGESADSKPKKRAKKSKKEKAGEAEETPSEVDAAAEEKPMENPTEEK
jgi:N utilization substance protein A